MLGCVFIMIMYLLTLLVKLLPALRVLLLGTVKFFMQIPNLLPDFKIFLFKTHMLLSSTQCRTLSDSLIGRNLRFSLIGTFTGFFDYLCKICKFYVKFLCFSLYANLQKKCTFYTFSLFIIQKVYLWCFQFE